MAPKTIAVVGAGATGLVLAAELKSAGEPWGPPLAMRIAAARRRLPVHWVTSSDPRLNDFSRAAGRDALPAVLQFEGEGRGGCLAAPTCRSHLPPPPPLLRSLPADATNLPTPSSAPPAGFDVTLLERTQDVGGVWQKN